MLMAKVQVSVVAFSFLCFYGKMLMANKRDDFVFFNCSLCGSYSRHEAKRRVKGTSQYIN